MCRLIQISVCVDFIVIFSPHRDRHRCSLHKDHLVGDGAAEAAVWYRVFKCLYAVAIQFESNFKISKWITTTTKMLRFVVVVVGCCSIWIRTKTMPIASTDGIFVRFFFRLFSLFSVSVDFLRHPLKWVRCWDRIKW